MNIVINIGEDIFTDIKEVDFDSARNIVRNYQATITDAIRNGTTERKVGKWEHDKLFGECAYVCSFCHTIWTSSEIENMHYCPTCGTEMRGAE